MKSNQSIKQLSCAMIEKEKLQQTLVLNMSDNRQRSESGGTKIREEGNKRKLTWP